MNEDKSRNLSEKIKGKEPRIMSDYERTQQKYPNLFITSPLVYYHTRQISHNTCDEILGNRTY